jgi:hypothetical protein
MLADLANVVADLQTEMLLINQLGTLWSSEKIHETEMLLNGILAIQFQQNHLAIQDFIKGTTK